MAPLEWIVLGASLLNIVSADLNFFIAPPAITPGPLPRLAKRQASACSSFLNIENSCQAATPGFTDLVFSSQVSCLCNPASVFDRAFSGCLGYLSTAEPDLYSSFTDLPSTPCAAFGAGGGGGGATTAPQTTTTRIIITSATMTSSATGSSNDPNSSACANLDSEISSCAAATPNFTNLPGTSAALCLCYDDSGFAPQIYDQNHDRCLSYIRTASPSRYSSLSSAGDVITSICSSLGDLAGGAATTTATTTTRRTSTSSTTRTTTRTTTTSTTTTSSNLAAAPTGVAGGASVVVAAGALALAVLL